MSHYSFIRFFFVALFTVILPISAWAQTLNVYGYVEGYEEPQLLTASQIDAIKTISHESLPTWLAIAIKLDTAQPELHLIDTEYFKSFPTSYGVHQAYAQEMGIVSGKVDFIARLKADGRPRSIMPFTFYIPRTTLEKNGKKAQWVLQNRRYIFKDDSNSFASSLDQSAQLFKDSMGGMVNGQPFFITYDQATKANGQTSTRRPNLQTNQGLTDIATLKALGYELVTEREMATLAGEVPPLVKVHNGNGNNQAFGYLKLVRTEDDMNDLTPQHIAIFPSLPDRIPPVAAILTLEDQTELSHINVLAINRGTLNIAVSQSATGIIPGILQKVKDLTGRPVRIQILGEEVSIDLASEADVSRFQDELKQLIGKVNIPIINLDGVIGVRKPGPSDTPATVGAKAVNYGHIERLLGNTLVKPGFAIDFDLYRHVVTAGGEQSIEKRKILPLIEKVKNGQLTPREVNGELANIRQAIELSTLPAAIVDGLEILANGDYSFLGEDEKIRFRSSTNCEDLPRFNGAGLYLSEGIKIKHLRGAKTRPSSMEKLHEDLLSVLASLWLPRAFWERDYFSIDHKQAALAVQINPSFSDEAANGVIVAQRKNGKMRYWVNSQFGEASVTNPSSGEIPESLRLELAADSATALQAELVAQTPTLHSVSSIGPVFLDADNAWDSVKLPLFIELLISTQAVLDDRVSDQENYGIDIEFKLMNESGGLKLYLKQARPINLSVGH